MNPSLPLTRFSSAVMLTGLMLLPAAMLSVASAQTDDSKAKAIGIAAAVEALPAGVRPPGRYALVIGADAYTDTRIPGLPACGNDARTLAAVLTDPQTGMVPKENLRLLVGGDVTKEKVIDALDNLGRKAGRDDLVIVFFSGHGATDERGRAYWIMSGTKADMLRATALPETDVSELLGEIHATRLVTFIDACYSAATANVAQTKSLLDLSKLYPDFKGDGRVAITASKGDQLSMVISRKEDPGFGYSAFAWHLIEGLKGKADTQGLTAHTGDNNSADGVVTVDELWAYVKDRTERTSRGMGGNQQPQIKGQLGSRFLLTVNSSRMLEIEREREARSQKVVERVAALRKLFVDDRINPEQFAQGRSLLEALPAELDVTQQKQRKVYEDLADGRIPAGYLTAGLDAIETPQQRDARLAREAQLIREAQAAKEAQAAREQYERDAQASSNILRSAKNDGEAIAGLLPLARQGNAHAMNELGKKYAYGEQKIQDNVQALSWFRKAAEQGNAEAISGLGFMYSHGRGVPKDDTQAVSWYRKAAEQGNAVAMTNLGAMYYDGRGVGQDHIQAASWYRKAAEKGQVTAMNDLGTLYFQGRGVPQDDTQAAAWFRKAAEQGHTIAMIWVGLMYTQGRGVPQDDTQAVSWYRKAVEKGDTSGMSELGFMYSNGRGVPKDEAQAVSWYRKAAALGNTNAQEELKKRNLKW